MTKEEVINILKYELSQISDDEQHPNLLQHKDFCKTVLDELQDRPTGHWIKENKPYGGFDDFVLVNTCSVCDESYIYHDINFNYCANCGAKMKGAEE